MDQLDIAVHSTAHNAAGGLPKLASKMGVGETVLRSKCNPNTETHKLSLREALSMMLLTDDVQILEQMAFELGHKIEPMATQEAPSVLAAVLQIGTAIGDVNKAVKAAMEDNRITQRELADINGFGTGAINELRTLMSTLAGLAEGGR